MKILLASPNLAQFRRIAYAKKLCPDPPLIETQITRGIEPLGAAFKWNRVDVGAIDWVLVESTGMPHSGRISTDRTLPARISARQTARPFITRYATLHRINARGAPRGNATGRHAGRRSVLTLLYYPDIIITSG